MCSNFDVLWIKFLKYTKFETILQPDTDFRKPDDAFYRDDFDA